MVLKNLLTLGVLGEGGVGVLGFFLRIGTVPYLNKINEKLASINSPMRTSKPTPGIGDCWWKAILDQAKLNNIESIKTLTPLEIRTLVMSNIKKCKTYPTWYEMRFKSTRAANKFISDQVTPHTYTDSEGIAVLATCELLNLTAHITTFESSSSVPHGTYNSGQKQEVHIFLDSQLCHFQSLKKSKMDLNNAKKETSPKAANNVSPKAVNNVPEKANKMAANASQFKIKRWWNKDTTKSPNTSTKMSPTPSKQEGSSKSSQCECQTGCTLQCHSQGQDQ